MSNTVDKVLAIAEQEVGYLEKSSKAYKADPTVLDRKTDGAGRDNYTKYGRDMHNVYPSVMDFPAYWCDCFVDWCFYKAYGLATAKSLIGGNFDDYTVASAQKYKDKKAWYTSNPQVGDQVFFHNGTRICHTGLVYKVTESYIYTIEGNTSSSEGVESNGGCVAKKSYKINNSKISGYGRPNYDKNGSSNSNSNTQDVIFQEHIKDLQCALNKEYKANLVVDGEPGPKTLAATPKLSISIKNKKPETVRALQILLADAGYVCPADGWFGSNTEKCVKEYQKNVVGLKRPDGIFSAKGKSWKSILKL